MKYKESKESSAEILRLVIPEMSKHEAAYHPVHYTIWYEYLSGINPSLKAAIDSQLSAGPRLNDQQLEALFQKHVASLPAQRNEESEEELLRLISEIKGLVKNSSSQASSYSNALEGYETQLSSSLDPELLKTIIQSLLTETTSMRASVAEMQQQLEKRADEVDALKSSLNDAKEKALTDPLTGLLNRRGLSQIFLQLKESAAVSAREPACVILVDIDHFKKVNDTYGHLFGDKVIKGLAEVLSAGVKDRGYVARLGGEEFAILLPRVASMNACAVAETLRSTMAKAPFRKTSGQEPVFITISLGVAEFVEGESSDAWINRADVALYTSKKQGRNRLTLYVEGLEALVPEMA